MSVLFGCANDKRKESRPMSEDHQNKLEEFRRSIDNLDAALIYLIAERFHLTQQVGEYKKANDLPPADPSREGRQIERLRRLAL